MGVQVVERQPAVKHWQEVMGDPMLAGVLRISTSMLKIRTRVCLAMVLVANALGAWRRANRYGWTNG